VNFLLMIWGHILHTCDAGLLHFWRIMAVMSAQAAIVRARLSPAPENAGKMGCIATTEEIKISELWQARSA
jgi:hypothetical protein